MDCDVGFVDRDFEAASMEFCLKINKLRLRFFYFFIFLFFFILNFRKETEKYYSINRKIKDKKKKNV